MLVIRPGQEFDVIDADRSVFLAGPTPRSSDPIPGKDWRPEALEWLTSNQLPDLPIFDTVFIPDPGNGLWLDNYDEQIDWEWKALCMASVILFWVPRDLTNMQGLTTNVEFGMFYDSGRAVLGYPPGAPKMRYLLSHARRRGVPIGETLPGSLELCQRLLSVRTQINFQ